MFSGKIRVLLSLCEALSSDPKFVLLMHPKEYRKAINTGKMVRNIVSNCELIHGIDFSDHPLVNSIVNDPGNDCYLLFPDKDAIDIENIVATEQRQKVFFVLDATWPMAKKMLVSSSNLQKLPKISFQSKQSSAYTIRKQPADHCLSTIETVHLILDRCGQQTNQEHDNLIEVFQHMVARQVDYEKKTQRERENS